MARAFGLFLLRASLDPATGAEGGATADGAPLPTNAVLVTAAFDIPRPADRDLVLRRDGERLTGMVKNDRLSLRTPYGLLVLATAKLAGVELAGPAREFDVFLTVNRNRFSGFLEDPDFVCQGGPGEQLAVRREEALKVIFRLRNNELAGLSRSPFVLLRNGDFFTGKLSGQPFIVVSATGQAPLDLGSVDAIQFPEGQPRVTRLLLRTGATLEGAWPAADLEFDLDLGPRLRLHPSRIAAIDCRQRTAPPEAIAVVEPPPAAAPRVESAAPPPGGRALPGLTWIVPGQFTMGSPPEETGRDLDEGPATKMVITRGLWMGTNEVTQAEYKAVMGGNPSTFLGDPHAPVERVTWREALDYCDRLTRLQAEGGTLPAGYAYRLPTEAEWEYACRAGTATRFSFGDDPDTRRLGDYAWFGDNSDSTTHPVGTKKPNAWGLYDMHGNVLEWCLDAATAALPGGTVTDYRAPAASSLRIARGGSWLYSARSARSANRDNYGENSRCCDLGFRVVLAPAENR